MNSRGIIFSAVLVCSCTSSDYQTLNRRNIDEYIVPSNIIQYFLPELPIWANFSETAKCRRSRSIHFLDFDKLKKNFFYSFEQLMKFQQIFNVEKTKLLEDRKYKFLGFKEEESLFYKVAVNIRSDINSIFIRPTFKRIHLVWIDPFITGEKKMEDMKSLFNKKEFHQGYPVLISQCLMYNDMQRFIKKHNLATSTKVLSGEFFTPYTKNFQLSYKLTIYIDLLFRKNQDIYLYTPTVAPDNIVGTFLHVVKI